jgi:hypothetical protein
MEHGKHPNLCCVSHLCRVPKPMVLPCSPLLPCAAISRDTAKKARPTPSLLRRVRSQFAHGEGFAPKCYRLGSLAQEKLAGGGACAREGRFAVFVRDTRQSLTVMIAPSWEATSATCPAICRAPCICRVPPTGFAVFFYALRHVLVFAVIFFADLPYFYFLPCSFLGAQGKAHLCCVPCTRQKYTNTAKYVFPVVYGGLNLFSSVLTTKLFCRPTHSHHHIDQHKAQPARIRSPRNQIRNV